MTYHDADLDLAQCLEVAVDIARDAGKFVLEGFHATKTVDTKKGPWDLVTEYDQKTEQIIVSGLTKKFPSHKFIGEEGEADKKTEPVLTDTPTWIIDPIDGTTNYVHGFHESCISIGLSVNKELVVGVIFNPMLNFMFSARKGHGAFLNDKRIYASKCTELAQSLVTMEVSFARDPKYHEIVMARLKSIVSVAHGIRSIGSAALTICYIANGAIDAYQTDGLKCWDVAAGVVILREAGGVVLDTSGGPFELMEDRIITAATKPLAEELVNVIKKADAGCKN